MPIAAVSLDDKYNLDSGRVYLTGLQALVRLPMMQRQRDVAAGLNTAGFISGYRGSPLGGYDAALWRAARFLKSNHIHFQAGLNEDLAATAVWGSQQVNIWPGGKYDGTFGIWYGKGPGVDRSGDAFKHGNINGTAAHGGVLAVAGDDHGAKSSTMAHQSEQAFAASLIPVLNPAGVQEYIDLGLYGFAMSRYSGCWIGFKAVGDTVESSGTVSIDPNRFEIALPEDFELPPGGLNIRYPDNLLEQEVRLIDYKLPAAQAFVRANRLDRIVMDSANARLGIITTGKAYLDLRQAFDELGIDAAAAAALGLRVYKVALTWPLEPAGARAFAQGLEQILVVEEKKGLIEDQLKKLLYNDDHAPRRIVGKTDEAGATLLPATGELTPAMVAGAVVKRIRRYDDGRPEFDQRLARLAAIEATAAGAPVSIARTPYFCSGCPHNTSTRVPDGSRAMAGIGCHGMALWMPDRNTQTIAHMGGEGVNWIGQAPFTTERHVFQNLGDGTYLHSGALAIRAAIAAGVNITYKILYNDAVAMTGGQPLDGNLTPMSIAHQVHAEGAAKVVVVADDPDKYPAGTDWPAGVAVHPRDALDRVQRDLREVEGVSVLIYDQTCAAEKRRRRKRGLYPNPPERIFINDLVCEGCGDCSETSNCVSVQPLDTEFGRKRQIDQSNCNKDYSCVKGFCPSFVSVHGGRIRKAKPPVDQPSGDGLFDDLPAPAIPSAGEPYGILITGIGGTGVITIGALLGMAAHVDGKAVSVLDMTGLSQKNGAVASHVRIADQPDDLHAVRIATGGARLLLGCDIVSAAAPDVLAAASPGTTSAVINSHVVPPAAFVANQNLDLSGAGMRRNIREAAGEDRATFVNATELATLLLGDSIATNMFMLGFAFQSGRVPLSEAAIIRAIELNAVAVEANRLAFAWGRLAAHDPARAEAAAKPPTRLAETGQVANDLETIVARRVAFLTDYQDTAYARRYRGLVDQVAAAERDRAKGRTGLAETVARNLFKLMAYKDEYEVARLYTDGAFLAKVNRQFEGDFKLGFHLAPPLLARRDPETGLLQKRQYGAWMFGAFRMLAGLRRLRGTRWDIFGRTAERRTERALIAEYVEATGELIDRLDQQNHALACRIAELPDQIRGFGHVKDRNIAAARLSRQRLLDELRAPAAAISAAE